MSIISAEYTTTTTIKVTMDAGDMLFVPDDMRNADRQSLAVWVDGGGVIAPYDPPVERRLVLKSVIISRLNDAGLLAAASAAVNADIYVRERWYAPDKPGIYSDDPEALQLLNAIGADPNVILAE